MEKYNIVEYFSFLTGLTPTESQKEVLRNFNDSDIHKLIISAGRQSGKTLTTACAVLWWLFESGQKVNILLLSAQDNILYYHLREIFRNHPELEGELSEISKLAKNLIPLHGFELKNGNKVFVKGITERNIRGIPSDLVIIDEACEVPNPSILTSLGNITGKISKIVLLSTPHVNTSLFVKWATEPKSGFKVCQWSAEGLSWHDPTIEATKKREMASSVYAVEVLGRPATLAERAFFPNKDITKCIVPCEPTREGAGKSTVEVGIDFGYGSPNVTCFTATERLYSKRKVLYIKTWRDFNAAEIAQLLEQYKPNLVKADSMPAEFRGRIEQHTKVKLIYVEAKVHKDAMLTQMQRRVRLHELIIPDIFVDLIKELERYKKGKRAGDNRVDSLCLSCYEPASGWNLRTVAKVYT